MRGNVILVAVLFVAASTLVTAVGMVWLCTHVGSCTKRFFLSVDAHEEADTVRQVTVTDALLRIEEAATDAKTAASRVAARVDVVTELAYQSAEGQHRMEDADAAVAGDLAASIHRADALPKDGNYGAAADAALRSGEEESG